jgi:cullin-4
MHVMKVRKEIMNEELKVAMIEAVKNHFVPDIKTIKQQIGWLCKACEAEYLRWDEDDPNLYTGL